MTSHAVKCPNCGSTDCNEYRKDGFVCRHCDSTFRWVNPSVQNVVHHDAVCHCGKKPIGACTRCGAPICLKHKAFVADLLLNWFGIKQIYVDGAPEKWRKLARQQGGLRECTLHQPAGWSRDRLMLEIESGSRHAFPGMEPHFTSAANPYSTRDPEELGPYRNPHLYSKNIVKHLLKMQQSDLANLLCLSCIESEFVRLLRPIESHIAKLVKAGRICEGCAAEWAAKRHFAMYLTPEEPDYRCADCGKSICSLCAQKCARCEKPICKSHETKVCRSCMANPLTKRSPSRMRWLLLILFLLISSGLSVLFSPFDQFATLTVVLLILFVALVCVFAYALLEPAGRWLGLW